MCTNYNAHIAIHSNSRRQLECTKITNRLISPYSMKSHIKEKVLLRHRKCNAVAYWFFYRFGMQTVKSFWKSANSLCGTIKRQSWETIRMRKWISVMQRHSRLLSAVLKKTRVRFEESYPKPGTWFISCLEYNLNGWRIHNQFYIRIKRDILRIADCDKQQTICNRQWLKHDSSAPRNSLVVAISQILDARYGVCQTEISKIDGQPNVAVNT